MTHRRLALCVLAAGVGACSTMLGIHEPDVAVVGAAARDSAVPENIPAGTDAGTDATVVFDSAVFDSGCPKDRADCNKMASDGCRATRRPL